MQKKRLIAIEKMMSVVFRAMDAFDTVRKRFEEEFQAKKKASMAPKSSFSKTPSRKSQPEFSGKTVFVKSAMPKPLVRLTVTKKMSSVRSGKKISSPLATRMLSELENKKMAVVSDAAEINGKKSLAWVVWALGVAEKTKMQEGISIHDVSSLLYHAAKIEIYPINVSRMVHDNHQYIRQVSQDRKTKRYLLTEEGRQLFSSLPK